ncbi:MAG: ATP-binding cassette domain-containing protein, partial [Deltaproteobacteria bacterium]
PVIDALVRMKLDLVGLGHALDLLPSELSGGMRKRAALARAIALDPELLCCDEPLAGLDPLSAAALDHLLLKLKNNFEMTLIVVTHELESIRMIADNVVMLDKGRVIAFGPLAEVERSDHPFIRNFFERRVDEEGRYPTALSYLGEG